MRAISLWQPWASLIFAGRKRFETRGFAYPPAYDGTVIAIHAAKKIVPAWMINEDVHSTCVDEFGASYSRALPLGCVLGTARLVRCYPTAGSAAPNITEEEHTVGNWDPGRFAWELDDITPLPQPVPATGKQGWWNWEAPNA